MGHTLHCIQVKDGAVAHGQADDQFKNLIRFQFTEYGFRYGQVQASVSAVSSKGFFFRRNIRHSLIMIRLINP